MSKHENLIEFNKNVSSVIDENIRIAKEFLTLIKKTEEFLNVEGHTNIELKEFINSNQDKIITLNSGLITSTQDLLKARMDYMTNLAKNE